MGNGASNFTIIRITPTLDTNAYAQNDVLFNPTEIPNAVRGNAGCSMLMAAYILDQSDTADSDINLFFTEGNTSFGTINDTANISDSNLEAIGVCSFAKVDADQAHSGAGVDGVRMHQVFNAAGTGEATQPLGLLQAAAGSTSVYVSGILTSATTPTYAADDIDIILHIQYK